MSPCYPCPTPVSTHRHPLEPSYRNLWPRAWPQTPIHKTLTLCHTQGHQHFSQTLPPPLPWLNTIPSPRNSLHINYWSALYSPTLHPFGAIYRLPKYRQIQILQSKCFRVISNYPRSTPVTHLHTARNLEPIHEFIYRLTDKFFYS